MAIRYDNIRIDASKVRKDARGFTRVDAIIAKPGVYSYTEPGGRTVREYLPPEEVARADSLASVQDAPVTNQHPRNMVDSSTWGSVSIGHASGPAVSTPEGALASLVVARGDAQSEIGRSLIEVSRGVQVRIDETPGVTSSGERYDRVQRDIVYNHIALGPAGWGRQGAGVSLRLDSNGDETFAEKTMAIKNPKTGVEFKTDAEAQAYLTELQSRADALPPFMKKKGEEEDEEDEDKKKAAKKDAADVQAKLDAAQARLDAIDARERAAVRTALEATARAVIGGEPRFDGVDAAGRAVPLTDRAVRELVIKRLDASAELTDKTDTYVEAYFDHTLKSAKKPGRTDGDEIRAKLSGTNLDGTRTDEKPQVRADIKMRQDANDAWKSNKGAAFSVK